MRRFTARAIVPITLAVTGFAAMSCLLLYSLIRKDMLDDDIKREAGLADTIVRATRYAMLKEDRAMLANIVDSVGRQPGIEHVRIFNHDGVVSFSLNKGELQRSVDHRTAGCSGCHDRPGSAQTGPMAAPRRFTNERGVAVLAITSPIYNEPDCFTAACHVHKQEQRILGTLDIGLDQAPLAASLAALRQRMLVCTLLLLVLCTAGVAAILRRTVVDPLAQIILFAERATHGKLLHELPDSGPDLGRLVTSIRRLAQAARPDQDSNATANEDSQRHARVFPPVTDPAQACSGADDP